MNASLSHKTCNRLFAGILATALSLGCCFPVLALPATPQPQAGEDSGTETPQPPMPKPVM